MSDATSCPHCGRSIRPCNLARHIAAKHADEPAPGSELPSVVEAVDRDLRRLRLRDSGLGATALRLAEKLDDPATEAPAAATAARALIRTFERIRELTPTPEGAEPSKKPDEKEPDRLDDLARRRARRRGSAS